MTRFNTTAAAFGTTEHDHQRCQERALGEAEALCEKRGLRLTEIRRAVLEIVWNRHAPVGAYDILDTLSNDRGRIAPPTVYRALDFLLGQGLIHRIESLNAYVGCPVPGEKHISQFLICRDCGSAAEVSDPAIDQAIDSVLAHLKFEAGRRTLEIEGLCGRCQRPHSEKAGGQ
ncbi:Fur family zinc uptake transcriptional regulator [Limibacillus sp. MBR-115]